MMKKLKYLFFVSVFVQFGCSNKPQTQEEVIEQFLNYVSTGECESAQALCTGNAIYQVQGMIDAGCESYDVSIDSLACETRGPICRCMCYENRDGMVLAMPYALELVGDAWKISDMTKEEGVGSFVDSDNSIN